MSFAAHPAAAARSSSALGADLLCALCAALVWSLVVMARGVGECAASRAFSVAFGSGALSLGVVVVVTRRALPLSRATAIACIGAALASAPLASLGALLRTHTHHRALGAVTYVFLALAVLALSAAVARRLLALASGASWSARAAGVVLAAASVGSLGSVVLGLRGALAAAGGSGPLAVVIDGATGVVASVIVVAVRRPRLSVAASAAAVASWVIVVGAGLAVLAVSPQCVTELSERAPVAVGAWGWLLAR